MMIAALLGLDRGTFMGIVGKGNVDAGSSVEPEISVADSSFQAAYGYQPTLEDAQAVFIPTVQREHEMRYRKQ